MEFGCAVAGTGAVERVNRGDSYTNWSAGEDAAPRNFCEIKEITP